MCASFADQWQGASPGLKLVEASTKARAGKVQTRFASDGRIMRLIVSLMPRK